MQIDPNIERTIMRDVFEHEIFLSFVNDLDAEMFENWWFLQGKSKFNQWVKENRENYEH